MSVAVTIIRPVIISKSAELRGLQRLDTTVCLEVLNTRLSLIAVILSGGSGGVVFKLGLGGIEASEVLGIHFKV